MTLEFLTHPSLSSFSHGFFTRRGGVSTGAYASLNCGLRSEDDPAAVRENRERVRVALGAGALRALRQVHGARAVDAASGWDVVPEADAMVCAEPDVALGVITADCAPVLLADPEARVVGAAHAGWRGAVGGILEATLAAMEELGAQRARIRAVVGPCIAQPSYEVGRDVYQAVGSLEFLASGRDADHWQFDLAGYCASRLAGIADVALMGMDTLTDEARFFSHRRRTLAGGGPLGHQISAIMA
ncbi:peptidoglycan editing factor PgeF [Sabulicella rubraurantiaca]|uniref:peptidoglycan editing factor PgeF n=1 Tax=Sabulicella rubraurantiaca TaxID=2811429 RepID=UPI001A958502|nr:peptidoglycan editing factor PgeF [Sabulicella rubraurantiaca]